MKLRKSLTALLGLFLILALATGVQAAIFDLNLSKLNGPLTTLSDVENIESVAFFGTAVLSTTPVTPDSGTFTEEGTVELKQYDNGTGTYEAFFDTGAELQFYFDDLKGTWDASSGATEISFETGQFIKLSYVDAANSIDVELATFIIGDGSGGIVVNELGTPQIQTYYLTLTEDIYDIFSVDSYIASLTASNFVGTNYVMAGEMSAVPVPSSLLLISSGIMCLAGLRRKQR